MSESKPTLSRRTALAGALAAGGAALATLPTTLLVARVTELVGFW
jgi:hypothetical protein